MDRDRRNRKPCCKCAVLDPALYTLMLSACVLLSCTFVFNIFSLLFI